MGYKLWPTLAMGYTLLIRTIELQNMHRLLSQRQLQVIFLGFLMPTFLAWLVLGFHWLFNAFSTDCVWFTATRLLTVIECE